MKKIISGGLLTLVLVSCASKNNTEQFVGNWIEDMQSNTFTTQGVTLNTDGSAASIGMASLVYEKWKVEGDKIILDGKSIGNGQTIEFSDSMNVIKISADTMILSRKFITGTVNYVETTYIRSKIDVETIKEFNPLDSLKINTDLGAVETRYFKGVLPAADCAGIDYKLWIYNQANSGDGVYKLTMTYLGADNGRDMDNTSFGRLYTLRGDATDKNATVYQLAGFAEQDTTNFLFMGDKLQMLGYGLQRVESELNYTLELQK